MRVCWPLRLCHQRCHPRLGGAYPHWPYLREIRKLALLRVHSSFFNWPSFQFENSTHEKAEKSTKRQKQNLKCSIFWFTSLSFTFLPFFLPFESQFVHSSIAIV
ncbi:MAG: hypothetical protein BYD32DRAFT_487494, partial [Podila humilis]